MSEIDEVPSLGLSSGPTGAARPSAAHESDHSTAHAGASEGLGARVWRVLRRPITLPSSDGEPERRRRAFALLGPVGSAVGFFGGLLAATQAGLPIVLISSLSAVGGYLVTQAVVGLQSVLRHHHRTSGTALMAGEIGLDLLGGSAIGAVVAGMAGAEVTALVGASAAVMGATGWIRRVTAEDWIDSAVRGFAGDVHRGEVVDYSSEYRLLDAGEIEEAVEAFEERSREMEGDPAPLIEAAQTLSRRGRWEHAVEMYAKAMHAPGVNAARASAIGRQIWTIYKGRLKRPAEGLLHLDALVTRHPDAPEVEWAWTELTTGATLASDGPAVPAIRAVEEILRRGFEARASDIHLEDAEDGLRVRYRVDGILQDGQAIPRRLRSSILARIRVMAELNPAQSPVPQDARIRLPWGDREVDVRVSTVPTLYGESIALRILDTEHGRLSLEQIGLEPEDLRTLQSLMRSPHGMILTTGPGGSGKSTTLHAIVQHLSTGREKIFTVEDPVEFSLPGVNQVSVNERAGLSFPRILRSLVRQDPDVLLVGEIRDTETAELACHAALTGHLVLSTLHTIDALSAMYRLVEIGIPEYMIVHTLEAAMAQRLVRRVCPACARLRSPTPAERSLLGWPDAEDGHIAEPVGCDRCLGTGYRGRVGIFEVVRMTEELREAFLRRAGATETAAIARSQGMRTLADDVRAKARAGLTSIEEVYRITAGGMD